MGRRKTDPGWKQVPESRIPWRAGGPNRHPVIDGHMNPVSPGTLGAVYNQLFSERNERTHRPWPPI